MTVETSVEITDDVIVDVTIVVRVVGLEVVAVDVLQARQDLNHVKEHRRLFYTVDGVIVVLMKLEQSANLEDKGGC